MNESGLNRDDLLEEVHNLRRRLADLEALREVHKIEAIGRLAGGIAHEFNNLLTVILGYCQVLTSKCSLQDPDWPILQGITKAGQRVAELTRQLLAFGQKQIFFPTVVDLNSRLSETADTLGQLAGEGIDLRLELASDLGWIRADPKQIDQVLLELMAQAREAMPGGGRLRIETRNVDLAASPGPELHGFLPGPYVLLLVEDSGPGLEEKKLRHLFEPFPETSLPGCKTGLGLATVHGIVKQSGGQITVETRKGAGTTFKIYLPRIAEPLGESSHQPQALEVPSGRETILLVEDEESVRLLVALVLRMAGYTVLEARTGAEALELANHRGATFDLLLTDVEMPGISGTQLAEKLKAFHAGLKTLYISGYTEDILLDYQVKETKAAFLGKPFTPATLNKMVRQVLESPSQ